MVSPDAIAETKRRMKIVAFLLGFWMATCIPFFIFMPEHRHEIAVIEVASALLLIGLKDWWYG